jgi:glycosyltransferase involved in cell wall biosynthesis
LKSLIPEISRKKAGNCFRSNQLISVVITTCNRIDTLLKTLYGVMIQDYYNYEIIIVDDGTNNVTEEYFNSIEVDWIKYLKNNKNLGASESRKKGYENSNGDIIIFSDDDDYFIDNEYFTLLVSIFDNNNSVALICSNSLVYKKDEKVLCEVTFPDMQQLSTKDYLNGFCLNYAKPNSSFTLALRKSNLNNIDFDRLHCFNDTSLYLYGLLSLGNVYFISDYIGVYYIHNNNMSKKVNPEFIITNFESKKEIYIRAKEMNLLNHPSKWFYQQILNSADYYFNGQSNGLSSDKKIILWGTINLVGHFRYLYTLKTFLLSIKAKIRLLIKGI